MKFTTVLFEKEKHLPILNVFLSKRGMPASDGKFLPPSGVCIYYYEQPVAFGFMIKCDNGMAVNTDLISDIGAPKDLRNAAADKLRDALYAMAAASNLQMVSVFCKHPKHIANLKKKGYVEIDTNLTQLGRFLWL